MDGRPLPIVDWPMLWRDHVEKTRREQKILFFRMHGFVLPKTKKNEYYAKAEERWPYEEEEEEEGKGDNDDEDVIVEAIEDENDDGRGDLQTTSEVTTADVAPEVTTTVKSSRPSLCSVKGNCVSDRAAVKKVGSLGHFLELLRSEESAAAAVGAAGEPEHGEKI